MSDQSTGPADRPGCISVVVPHYGESRILRDCLASLRDITFPRERLEIIVVDNGSHEPIEAIIDAAANVRMVRNDENLGFSRAANMGARAANGEYVAFLNNDARVHTNWLAVLAAVLAGDSRIGCAGSTVMNWDGSEVQFAGRRGDPFCLGFERAVVAGTRPPSPTPSLFASGGAMLIRRRLFLDVGGFDPDFFMYQEDVDLGWRLWLRGHQTVIASESLVFHRGGATSSTLPLAYVHKLAQKHALESVFKNLGEDNLHKRFPQLVAALLERGRWAPDVLTALPSALQEFRVDLDVVAHKRTEIQRTRTLSDSDLFSIVGDPLGILLADASHHLNLATVTPSRPAVGNQDAGSWLARFDRWVSDAQFAFAHRLVTEVHDRERFEQTYTAEIAAGRRELRTVRRELVAAQGEVQRLESESARLATALADRESRMEAALRLAEQRQQALMQLSEWAAGIDRKPLTYAVKKRAVAATRLALRVLRFSPAQADNLRRSLRLLRRRNARPAMTEPGTATAATASFTMPKPAMPSRGDVFIFGITDWHFRTQRPQHLAAGLAESGWRVFFVSNQFIDTPEPGYHIELVDASLPRLAVVKLHVAGAPAIYFSAPAPETEAMLRASMGQLILDADATSSISIVEHPFWYSLATSLPNSYRVYDCMDHHEGFGNVAADLLELEKRLLRDAELVTVTSTPLARFARTYNQNVVEIRNGVDYDFIATRPRDIYVDPQGRKIVGYHGAIAEWFDPELVREAARQNPDCLILLVGRDTGHVQAALKDLPNVTCVGEVPYSRLPYYLHAFDVGLLPFRVMPLTLATNPVKVYEYLAAGKPVVAVALPEMDQFGDLVMTAEGPHQFAAGVTSALAATQRTPEAIARRRGFAVTQTWAHRTSQLEAALKTIAMPKVSVIVLSYNNAHLTEACIRSVIEETDYPNLEVIVVDNASDADSRERLQQLAHRYPQATFIFNATNRGFAGGNNVGLKRATGDYLVLLNNDTVVTRGWLLTLMRHLQADPRVGLIGPVTNNIGNDARIETAYGDLAEMPAEAARYTIRNMGIRFAMRNAAFFCVMMPRSTYQRCGPLCEDYGLGFFEDDDYCRRIEAAGLTIACADDVFVHHHLSASFNSLNTEARRALFDENRATYERKWGRWIPHTYRRQQPIERPREA